MQNAPPCTNDHLTVCFWECWNYCTITFISRASKIMLKILQARLQQYINHELPDVQAGFRKGRETRDQIANTRRIIKKAIEKAEKYLLLLLLTVPKPLTVWITTNCGKFLKTWEYQNTLPVSWETCMQVKKQQLEMDMEHRTGFKSGKEYIKAVYCHPAYLTYMQSTSWETLGWKKHKLESAQTGIKIARRNINNLRYAEDTTLMTKSEK